MRSYKAASLVWLCCVTACTLESEQASFVLRLAQGRENALEQIVPAAARKLGMRSTSEAFDYGAPGGKLRTYMLSGRGTQVMIRSLSVEECQVREGRREPEFSTTLYGVSAAKTWPSLNAPSIKDVIAVIREAARPQGAYVLSEVDKCKPQ